ncbi:GNAT family N-acetyltransferase [Geodermatophilus sp. URMC 62]|uniref:GNAT family N-acetyltransferase n=1 Tax=Geodermatophilus sp. URMC 62 TaxID=3423414 RepID=UPI00406C6B56
MVGWIALSTVARGAFPSCRLGYWVRSAADGRGRASAAVREMVATAFGELGPHRVEAATLVHDAASRRVLERTGSTRFGPAPGCPRIAGRRQDHVLFPLLGLAAP